MTEFVTPRELNKELTIHAEKCDAKISKQTEYRHNLANDISNRIAELEDHMDTKNTTMLEKIEKILILVTHNSDVTKTLSKSYKKLGDEFTDHMKDETTDRKELISKLDDAKTSRVSKYFFGWAIGALVAVLGIGAGLITYTLTSLINVEKDQVEFKTTQSQLIERVIDIEEELK